MGFDELMMSLNLGLIFGIVGMGVFITFKVIDFPDLTCDGSFAFGLAVTGVLIQQGVNPYYVLLVSVIAGALAGAVTGILNAYFKVTDLLAGILVTFMLYSVNVRVMSEQTNRTLLFHDTSFSVWTDKVMAPLEGASSFIQNLSMDHPMTILIVISLLIIGLLTWLLSTDMGLSIRAIGQNKRLCQNSGVNVKWMVILGVAMGNGLVALGGSLFGQFTGVADINAGIGTIITGFAAVIIGEKVLPFRSIWVKLISCILGSTLFHLIKSAALNAESLNLEAYDFNIIAGVIIVLVMVMPGGRRKC